MKEQYCIIYEEEETDTSVGQYALRNKISKISRKIGGILPN